MACYRLPSLPKLTAETRAKDLAQRIGNLGREWNSRSQFIAHNLAGDLMPPELASWLSANEDFRNFSENLGTVGGGNHFAEIQIFEEVHEPEALQAADINPDQAVLLGNYGGSRGRKRGWGDVDPGRFISMRYFLFF
jgi:hypothetical protein